MRVVGCFMAVLLAAIVPHAAGAAKAPLCSEGKVICVAAGMENGKLLNPLRIRAEIAGKGDIQVGWELKDSTGATLVSGSTWQYPGALKSNSSTAQTLDVTIYLVDPAKSDHGVLTLTPTRTDVSSENMNLPALAIPVRLETATTQLSILMPADRAGYDADVQAYADEPKPADFHPKTPLVLQTVTVMKVEDSSRMAATAQAVLRAMPGQGGPWQVKSLRVQKGTVHLQLNSDAWAGVSYYWLSIGYLLKKTLERFPGVRKVEFK